ncbi:MAG TPA: HU family DNA-binding protein [bacterium]|nr:HU family DNA-binding protein [bacterium]
MRYPGAPPGRGGPIAGAKYDTARRRKRHLSPEHPNPEHALMTEQEGCMTKAQFAAKLAEKLKVSKAEGGRVVDEVTDLLTAALKKGDRVRFPGFGSFRVSKRKARIARNPQTGEPVRVPARTVPRFTAAKELKAAVK